MSDIRHLGRRAALFDLGLIKTGQTVPSRSYAKDFLAGVDPTGTFTMDYGVRDAPKDTLGSGARLATGIVGGTVGGGLLIPSVITGMIQAPSGIGGGLKGVARNFWHGFRRPVRAVYQGVRTGNILKHAPQRGISPSQAKFLKGVAKETDAPYYAALTEQALPGAMRRPAKAQAQRQWAEFESKGLTPEQVQKLQPGMLEEARSITRGELANALSTLGIAGGISGGSAGLQYSKGRSLGGYMTPEQRAAATGMTNESA